MLSLWMSLATAIVCAVVPAGLPSTRSTGSAFDPSTTIVALRSRPPAAPKITVVRPSDGDGTGIGGRGGDSLLGAAVPVTIVTRAATASVPLLARTAFALIARPADPALYARPPPLF